MNKLQTRVIPIVVLTAAVGGVFLYSTIPAMPPPGRPPSVVPYYPPVPPPVVRATPAIYPAVRNALIAAGVDEDKVDGPAADLSASIEQAIAAKTDEVWFYGKIAAAALAATMFVALLALLRHAKPPIDLSHLEAIVREAQSVRVSDDDRLMAWRQHP